jgi:hypothetical protein
MRIRNRLSVVPAVFLLIACNPAEPQDIEARAISYTAIELNWTAGLNAKRYEIQRSTDEDGPFKSIVEVDSFDFPSLVLDLLPERVNFF